MILYLSGPVPDGVRPQFWRDGVFYWPDFLRSKGTGLLVTFAYRGKTTMALRSMAGLWKRKREEAKLFGGAF